MPDHTEFTILTQDDVRQQELQQIAIRREVAGFQRANPTTPQSGATDRKPSSEVQASLVGLAFSGGGLRSAAFNLGLLQAFHRFGLLRWIDILSAVSGGSYVAGMFAAAVQGSRNYGRNSFELAVGRDGDQPACVTTLMRNGNYLIRPDLLGNRYLIGLTLNLMPWVSLLIAVAALIALLWRTLDHPAVREDILMTMGIESELVVGMLPGIVISMGWFATWVAAMTLRSAPLRQLSGYLFVLTIVSVLISAAVVIGNGDIVIGQNQPLVFQNKLRWIVPAISGLGLIPLLLPRRLLQSGARGSKLLESWVFYYFSFTLLIGIPLTAISLLARENVSGYASYRNPSFDRGDLKDSRSLAQLITSESGSNELQRSNLSRAFATEHVVNAAKEYASANQRREQAKLQLLGPSQFSAEPLRLSSSWWKWRYSQIFNRVGSFVQFVSGARDDGQTPGASENAFHAMILRTRELRRAEQRLVNALNVRVKDPGLYRRLLRAETRNVSPEQLAQTIAGEMNALRSAIPTSESSANASTHKPADHYVSVKEVAYLLALDNSSKEIRGPLDEEQILAINRKLVEGFFPDHFRSRADVQRRSVIAYDQGHRLMWFSVASLLFIVTSVLVNPNVSSLHSFYRDRLAWAFLRLTCNSEAANQPLRAYQIQEKGAPLLVFGAAINRFSPLSHPTQLETPFDRFTLSPSHCGSAMLKYRSTKNLAADQELTLADTMAISGAALTPTYFVHHILTIVMAVLNLRLGKWLPNPTGRRRGQLRLRTLSIAWQAITRDIQHRDCILVTDGGHAENLGVGELLDRRCALIVLSDAGYDPDFHFASFAKLVREYRNEHGIEFYRLDKDEPVNLTDAFQPVGSGKPSNRHFLCARIRYPANESAHGEIAQWGLLVYIKPTLTGDEDADVINYHRRNPSFPHDKTADQAFNEAQFESYRRLGYVTGLDLCQHWQNRELALWEQERFDLSVLVRGFANIGWPLSRQSAAATEQLRTEPTSHANGTETEPTTDTCGCTRDDAMEKAYARFEQSIEKLAKQFEDLPRPTVPHWSRQWKRKIGDLRQQILLAKIDGALNVNQQTALLDGIRKLLEEPLASQNGKS